VIIGKGGNAKAQTPGHELLGLNVEGLANPQQCEQGRGASRLDHLPVADAKPVGNHVLLAQFALRSIRADAMAKGAEETLVACRNRSSRPPLQAEVTRAE
jgi:hypothetical protein